MAIFYHNAAHKVKHNFSAHYACEHAREGFSLPSAILKSPYEKRKIRHFFSQFFRNVKLNLTHFRFCVANIPGTPLFWSFSPKRFFLDPIT